jgi:hypothetical protein
MAGDAGLQRGAQGAHSIAYGRLTGYAMLCYATLCYAMLCYAMLCYAMLCYAMPCHAMLCYTQGARRPPVPDARHAIEHSQQRRVASLHHAWSAVTGAPTATPSRARSGGTTRTPTPSATCRCGSSTRIENWARCEGVDAHCASLASAFPRVAGTR